jgi:hypothetical protein
VGGLLISGLQENSSRYLPEKGDADLPELRQDTLEKIADICNEEGIAVLELKDTGDVFIAERDEDGDIVLWKVTR